MINNASPNAGQIQRFVSFCPVPLTDVSVALDLGCRDGEISLHLAEWCPRARIFAFEPNPAAIVDCRRNLLGHDRIKLIEAAAADKTGTVDFYAIDPNRTLTDHADGSIGASSLYQANPEYPLEKYAQDRIQVRATTLKDWAEQDQVDHVDIMWMDIQGAELQALQGMGNLLDGVQLIQAEVEFKPMYHGQPLADDVIRFLEKNGFRLADLQTYCAWFGDAIFVRHGSRIAPHAHRIEKS
jgi:FkbM family methyltransferase